MFIAKNRTLRIQKGLLPCFFPFLFRGTWIAWNYKKHVFISFAYSEKKELQLRKCPIRLACRQI